MGILNKVRKSMADSTKAIKGLSSDVTEITKLKVTLSKDMATLDSLYYDLGKIFFRDYQDDKISDMSSDLITLLEQMDTIHVRIVDGKAKIDSLKGVLKCCNCDYQLEQDINFCPNCGHKVHSQCCGNNNCSCECNCSNEEVTLQDETMESEPIVDAQECLNEIETNLNNDDVITTDDIADDNIDLKEKTIDAE